MSDLHAGYSVTESDISRLAEIINTENVDLTIICGDLIDSDLKPVLQENTLAPLTTINSKFGVWAIMGNHDYFDDASVMIEYVNGLEGVTLLRDSVAEVGPFRVIGRDDVSISRFGAVRRDIESFGQVDSLFTIVADHQPSAIRDAVNIGADLSLSGHTHAGQIWPMGLFTKRIYELDYGCGCYGETTVIVTSGFGTWGPKVRLGSPSEVVFVDIKGTRKS